MSAAWTMITVINLNLILLIMVIKHKEVIDSKPVRKIARKMPIKKPVTKKVTKEIKQL
jgi:hypothetical protein